MPTMLTRWWTVLSSRTSPLRWQHAASYTMYESVTASAFICHRMNCNATVRSPAFKVTGGTEVIAASRRRERCSGQRERGEAATRTWLGDDAAASGQTGQDQSSTERQARQTAVTACMAETARLQKS